MECITLKQRRNRYGSIKRHKSVNKRLRSDIYKNDNFHFYEYLMIHPNRETYYLFIDNWTQNVVRIHVSELLNGDYYIGDYDSVFVNEKMIEFYKRMIHCHENRIKESLKKNSYGTT